MPITSNPDEEHSTLEHDDNQIHSDHHHQISSSLSSQRTGISNNNPDAQSQPKSFTFSNTMASTSHDLANIESFYNSYPSIFNNSSVEFELPPECSSEERMAALFGPLELSSSANSAQIFNRDHKLKFWINLIIDVYLKHSIISKQLPLCSLHHLKMLLNRKGLVPIGLETIMKELIRLKVLVPLENLVASTDYYSSSWILRGLKATGHMIQHILTRCFESNDLGNTVYLIIPAVRKQASQVAESVYQLSKSQLRHVFTMEDLKEKLAIDHLEILLTQLPVTFFCLKNKKCIKFYQKKDDQLINQVDQGILLISSTIELLNIREEQTLDKIEITRGKVVEALSKTMKKTALSLLRRKKLLEQTLDQILASREKLEQILMIIESNQVSFEVFQVLKAGSLTLERTNIDVNISNVQELDEALTEMIAQQDEIRDVLSSQSSADSQALLDEDKVELDQLLLDIAEKQSDLCHMEESKLNSNDQNRDSEKVIEELASLEVSAKTDDSNVQDILNAC